MTDKIKKSSVMRSTLGRAGNKVKLLNDGVMDKSFAKVKPWAISSGG